MDANLYSPFLQKVVMCFVALICIILANYGISAPVFYVFFIGIIFPVIISMRLHRLSEAGTALTITEDLHWTTYIHGFPAQERLQVLKNPCFWSPQRVKEFFMSGIIGKIVLQCITIAILIHEYIPSPEPSIKESLAAMVLMFIVYKMSRNLWTLYLIAANRWQCETLTTKSGSLWYQGFMKKGKKRVTLFSRLV